VVELAFEHFGRGTCKRTDLDHPPEAALLRLDATLAEQTLGWAPPLPGLDAAVEMTVDWWRTEAVGGDLRALALAQLDRVLECRPAR
jgi:CDP-glucose 4,6-dehydratase